MIDLFLDANRRLRNGWWMLIFLATVALTVVAYRPLKGMLLGLGVAAPWLEPLPFLLSLLATWACLRARRESLAAVGFRLDRRWLKESAYGALFGTGAMLVIAGLVWAAGGVRFELDPGRSAMAAGYGLYVFFFAVLLEENLFRGFLFQRLVDGAGVWVAQLALAVLFAFAHWGNPGMTGATLFWATLDTALGAVMLGLAYLRTRSLALPIGLHLGWNWTQGTVLGFGVSGYDHAGLLHPVLQDKAQWLTGGSFGPEASVFAVVADLGAIALLWAWKGSAAGVVAGVVAPDRDRLQDVNPEVAPVSRESLASAPLA